MHTVTPGGNVTNRLSTYRDISPYFDASRTTRLSWACDCVRLEGALFSIYAAFIDSLQIPQFVARLNNGATK